MTDFVSTLTVDIAPQVAVTPISPTPAAGMEMFLPFQIDPATGGIAFTSDDLLIKEQHISTIVNTVYTERVMVPVYGTPLARQLFSSLQMQGRYGFLVSDITKAIAHWEPSVKVTDVQIKADQFDVSTLNVSVTFTVPPKEATNIVSITVGGAASQVVSQ